MNKSMDASQSGVYLPPIARNDSASIVRTSRLGVNADRSMSQHEMNKVGSLNATPLFSKFNTTEALKNV